MYIVRFLFSHGNDVGRNACRKWYDKHRVPLNCLFTGKGKSEYGMTRTSLEDITLV